MGTRRRGGGAFQSWVKPEVDPPRISALARGVDLEFGREGFDVGVGNGRAVKVREFFGVDDCLDFLTQTLWHSLEADFQRFENGLLLGENQTFLSAFFTTLLTTFADAFLAELFGE